ncbi:MAG: sulfatase-like hydrolase/transferase [Vulcanimicrobiota bacterium]
MKRRDFVKSVAAVGALSLAGCGNNELLDPFSRQTEPEQQPPNILFMMVDEMRYPVHFPAGVSSADEYIERFMPNLYRHLWRDGVKFTNHRVAAGACTPSRGVMLTGLYAQQTWVINTIGAAGDEKLPPSLSPEYPTYGSLLKEAGYETPYFGKFHITVDSPYEMDQCPYSPENYLAAYGFDDSTCPDPGGTQGQGVSGDGLVVGDREVADQAIDYLSDRKTEDRPFCATVSFVNPHDYQFFWGGTEPQRYTDLFAAAGEDPLIPYDPRIQSLSDPPPQGFPPVPPNWESFDQLQANKPRSQVMFNEGNHTIFGAISFDPNSTDFEVQPSRILHGLVSKGVAPYSYWQRGQDSYAQVLGKVDEQIGRVLDALSPEVRDNTVIVFTSDHGDYVGSHGFLAGKVGTVYDEALRIPLVVRDYTGRFATEPELPRDQLTSSVDIMSFLVTLGYNGSREWMQGELAELYAGRHDLLGVAQSSQAPGREKAFYTTDEYVLPALNFNLSPVHVVGVMTPRSKLGIYNYWAPGTVHPLAAGRDLEFYDHDTPGGRAELDNRPNDPRARRLLEEWLNEDMPNEVRRPLPDSLEPVQTAALEQYLDFVQIRDSIDPDIRPTNLNVNFGIDRLPR